MAIKQVLQFLFALIVTLGINSPAFCATVITPAASGKLGSPINGENGRIYIADKANSRLFVISIETDAVSTISLPGQPGTLGSSLSISKDKSLMAVPLTSGSIAIVNLATDQVVASYGLGGKVPQSTAFGASNSIVFFSTEDNFDDIYVLNTSSNAVVHHFGFGPGLTDDGTDLLLLTSADGNKLYILSRFGSPGRLHKVDVTNPLSPTFVASDNHGSLGSNCRGLALIPASAPAPSQGHEAYLACGAPYYVQAITQSGTLLFPATQYATAEYPVGVDVFSNGDVAGLKDAGSGDKAFVFDSSGTKKSSFPALFELTSPTDDGIAAALVNGLPRMYLTSCGYTVDNPTNCVVQYVGSAPAPTPTPTATPTPGGPSGLVSLTLSKSSFPKAGGTLTITSKINTGGDISATKAQLKSGSKTINVTLKGIPGKALQYKGSVVVPKNTTKKAVVWAVTASAKINGSVNTSASKNVTVAK